jgi:hypothetical protein
MPVSVSIANYTIERLKMSEKEDQTRCFTYEVKMIVQILADTEDTAKKQLDDKGGYVSSRAVKLLDSVPLLSE